MFSASKTKQAVSGGLTKSLRFRSSASAYLSRTTSSTTNQKTWTWSGWLKIGDISASLLTPFSFGFNPTSATDVGSFFRIYLNQISLSQTTNGSADYTLTTNQIFRDPSAWYHFVIAFDTTQAVSTNRIKLYVNGSQVTSFGTANYPSQNFNTSANLSGGNPKIGAIDVDQSVTSQFFDGYMSEINFIDGQQLTPSSFGVTDATTGVWQPKAYSGSYGTNGFHLTFTNTASTTTLGYDTSGNSNNWTTNNISLTAGSTYDSMNDVPTLTSATASNYAVLNPNDSDTARVMSNGNLTFSTGAATWGSTRSTFFMPSGKWYWEVNVNTGPNTLIGIATSSAALASYLGVDSYGYAYVGSTGQKVNSATVTSYGATFGTGDTIGIAYDASAGSLTFYKNGTSQGVAFSGLSDSFSPAISVYQSTLSINFGQQPFTYTPPSGYVALNTYNLPTPAIVQGNKYMDATLYTGTLIAQSITNAGSFKPDLVWIKARSAATDNKLTDSNRGATKALISNTTGAETTDTLGLTAFNSNGFTISTDTNYNNSGVTYVGWQWQAGQGSNISNTNGSITSTVSANTTSGFSIVTYTGNATAGATVGHGLGVAPSMVICKTRTGSSVGAWQTYHSALGATKTLFLNLTDAAYTNTLYWNNTAPTSSVFSLGSNTDGNGSGYTMVAYCFAQIAGFSAFGSYTGNGSTSGPFIYCGFRPAYVMVKASFNTESWYIIDNQRSPYNNVRDLLQANSSASTVTFTTMNLLSNGFQLINTDTSSNASGYTYIYMAFASNPFKYSNAF